jgi:hypothetical protein
MPSETDPKGRILNQKYLMDGTSLVVLDNGPVATITITCLTEQLQDLLASDLPAIRAHLMTRRPGHFRRK